MKARLAEGSLNLTALENLNAQSQLEEGLESYEADVGALMQDLKELKKDIVGDSEDILTDWVENKTENEVFGQFK